MKFFSKNYMTCIIFLRNYMTCIVFLTFKTRKRKMIVYPPIRLPAKFNFSRLSKTCRPSENNKKNNVYEYIRKSQECYCILSLTISMILIFSIY